MNEIKENTENYYEVKNSKFYSYLYKLYSSKDINSYLDFLKSKHAKARHFVYAYRISKNNFCDEYFFDDGEPKLSSGVPVLNVIKGFDLVNVLVIVVRYFGGTKLGLGGLVKAYTESAKSVINIDNINKYVEIKEYKFDISYDNLSIISLLETRFDLKVSLIFNENNKVSVSFKAPLNMVKEINKIFKFY